MQVLKIGAIWCAECVTMKPMWEEIEQEVPELKTEYIDADENEELLKEYDVKEIPTFIFLDKENKEMFRLKGLQNKEELIKTVKENLNK